MEQNKVLLKLGEQVCQLKHDSQDSDIFGLFLLSSELNIMTTNIVSVDEISTQRQENAKSRLIRLYSASPSRHPSQRDIRLTRMVWGRKRAICDDQ